MPNRPRNQQPPKPKSSQQQALDGLARLDAMEQLQRQAEAAAQARQAEEERQEKEHQAKEQAEREQVAARKAAERAEKEREKQEQRSARQQERVKKIENNKSVGWLKETLGGDLLSRDFLRKNLLLLLLVMVLLMLVISNRYRVEQLSREKKALKEEINYLRENSIQMQREYQQSIKISCIAEALDSVGVGMIAGPPFEIK